MLPALFLMTAAAAIAGGFVPPLGALILGAVYAVVFGPPAAADAIAKHLLAISIVALGFGVDFGAVLAAGRDGLFMTTFMLALTFGAGALLARRLGLRSDLALLVTAGTAICGGSAIAAIAPLLRARSTDVTAAVGVVFLLNSLALFLFPIVGPLFALDSQAFGQWCALAIHDTSSVVGAAATFSPEALEIATVTKLTRALWIVPVGALIVMWRQRGPTQEARPIPRPPWFLVGFLLAAVLVTVIPEAAAPGRRIARCAPVGMTLALFGIGLGLSPRLLRQVFGRAFGFGLVLWLLLTLVALGQVYVDMLDRGL